MQDSIFTKIIKGEIACHKVYEDELTIAFLDVHPQLPGHTLLISKVQVDHIWDLPDELYHHLWDVAKKISSKMNHVLSPPRVGVSVEGFGVPHVHIHIMPLYDGEDFKKPQDMEADPDHSALAEMADKLRISN